MDLKIRLSLPEDAELFKRSLQSPDVLRYFPMYDIREIEDSARIWDIYCKKGASLTAVVNGVDCGIAFLNLQVYKKFAHQCLITIIVDEGYRNRGVGTALLKELFKLAKETFHLEMLHLEVYETNPAINLYKRMGFKEFGNQDRFIKENGKYIGKTLMERFL
ncbi:MAG: GNAT family N-acetyltransferase [Verrucomicrobia bacterium]|nr:GNAT family N-acetyltransferase [Verrucomicrobiota bacterium]